MYHLHLEGSFNLIVVLLEVGMFGESAGSRPSDKEGGAVIQTLRYGGGEGGGREQSPKIFFGPFGPQFGLRLRARGPNPRVSPLDPPLGDYN